jgi:hypothetical protein
MRNTTFISSMVVSVACVSAANATVVYNTIDPFTTSASASASTSTSSGYVYSALTGTLWEERGIKTTTNSIARATTTISSIGSGSMVFGVTQVGTANTATGTNQKAYLDYFTPTGSELYPDFTNFTSLDFNFASTLSGTLKCIIRLSDAANWVEKTMSGSSGLMSFTLADFGGIDPLNVAAVGPLSIEFIRSGSNASGSLTITNLVANGASVPAPGAIALLGAAGLIGARRRRD